MLDPLEIQESQELCYDALNYECGGRLNLVDGYCFEVFEGYDESAGTMICRLCHNGYIRQEQRVSRKTMTPAIIEQIFDELTQAEDL